MVSPNSTVKLCPLVRKMGSPEIPLTLLSLFLSSSKMVEWCLLRWTSRPKSEYEDEDEEEEEKLLSGSSSWCWLRPARRISKKGVKLFYRISLRRVGMSSIECEWKETRRSNGSASTADILHGMRTKSTFRLASLWSKKVSERISILSFATLLARASELEQKDVYLQYYVRRSLPCLLAWSFSFNFCGNFCLVVDSSRDSNGDERGKKVSGSEIDFLAEGRKRKLFEKGKISVREKRRSKLRWRRTVTHTYIEL